MKINYLCIYQLEYLLYDVKLIFRKERIPRYLENRFYIKNLIILILLCIFFFPLIDRIEKYRWFILLFDPFPLSFPNHEESRSIEKGREGKRQKKRERKRRLILQTSYQGQRRPPFPCPREFNRGWNVLELGRRFLLCASLGGGHRQSRMWIAVTTDSERGIAQSSLPCSSNHTIS